MPFRVAIDATPLLGNLTGIGVTTRDLINALSARPELDLRAFALTRHAADLESVLPSGVAFSKRAWPAEIVLRLWQRLQWPDASLWTGKVDVVHGTNFVVPPARRTPRVVTVNDLYALKRPDQVTASSRRYPSLIRRAVESGAFVHVPSRATAEALVEWLPAAEERTCVVCYGIATPDDSPLSGIDIAGFPQYALFLGTIEPRKGLPVLIKAWTDVQRKLPDVRLVIAGASGWGQEAVTQALAESPVADSIVFAGRVDDAARTALLRDAQVLCMPSLDEGFGLPVLEAMALGTPVVSSDGGSLPEVVGDAGVIVPVGDVDALADALIQVLSDEHEQERLATLGLERAAKFTWQKAADEMIALYERVANSRS